MYRARRDAVKALLAFALMPLLWALPLGALAQTAEKTLHVQGRKR
jgi:hypothetical protein